MNYSKVFLKGVLQTIIYYMILVCIGLFNIPFMIFFYLKNVFKAAESNEQVNDSTHQAKTMKSATEY
jgi:hypothetical protein